MVVAIDPLGVSPHPLDSSSPLLLFFCSLRGSRTSDCGTNSRSTTRTHGAPQAGQTPCAGVEVSAHDFRRTFATHWIRNCRAPSPAVAEQLVRVQLGHSAQNVTQAHYLALDHTDVAKYYVSPLDGIDLWGL